MGKHSFFFFFKLYGDHRDLPSSPTRRSPDLKASASFKLLTSPACEQARSTGSRSETSPNVERKGRGGCSPRPRCSRSEEHTSELQSQSNLVCRLLLEKKNT